MRKLTVPPFAILRILRVVAESDVPDRVQPKRRQKRAQDGRAPHQSEAQSDITLDISDRCRRRAGDGHHSHHRQTDQQALRFGGVVPRLQKYRRASGKQDRKASVGREAHHDEPEVASRIFQISEAHRKSREEDETSEENRRKLEVAPQHRSRKNHDVTQPQRGARNGAAEKYDHHQPKEEACRRP